MKPPLTYGTLEVRLSALVTRYDRARCGPLSEVAVQQLLPNIDFLSLLQLAVRA